MIMNQRRCDSRAPLLTWHIIVTIIHRPLVHLIGCIKLASSVKVHDCRTSSDHEQTLKKTQEVRKYHVRAFIAESATVLHFCIVRKSRFSSIYPDHKVTKQGFEGLLVFVDVFKVANPSKM